MRRGRTLDGGGGHLAMRAGEVAVVVFAVCGGALLVVALARLVAGTQGPDTASTVVALISPAVILVGVMWRLFRGGDGMARGRRAAPGPVMPRDGAAAGARTGGPPPP